MTRGIYSFNLATLERIAEVVGSLVVIASLYGSAVFYRTLVALKAKNKEQYRPKSARNVSIVIDMVGEVYFENAYSHLKVTHKDLSHKTPVYNTSNNSDFVWEKSGQYEFCDI